MSVITNCASRFGLPGFALGALTLLAPSQASAVPIVNYDITVFGGTAGPFSTNSTSANLVAGQTGPLAGISPTSIGIRLDFDLTPGETVTFNGAFAFVPAPGCLALLGLAGLTGSRRRRD